MILDVLLVEYSQSLSLESMEQSMPLYWPGRGDSITRVLASNKFIALIVFIVVIWGLSSSLGYLYTRFFSSTSKVTDPIKSCYEK
jgi:hypothetical protein